MKRSIKISILIVISKNYLNNIVKIIVTHIDI